LGQNGLNDSRSGKDVIRRNSTAKHLSHPVTALAFKGDQFELIRAASLTRRSEHT
jgi:hypothetical protein